jgi:CysZ protein
VVIPGLIYAALFVTAMYFFGRSATAVIEYVTYILRVSDWIQKFQNSLLGFLFTFAGIILWLTLLLFYFSFFKYICLIIGSPMFAYLSRKTEAIIENNENVRNWAGIRKEMARGVRMAIRNCGWQTVYLVALLILAVIPVIGWVVPLAVLLMLDYGMARNNYKGAESIDFIGNHKGLAIGNGILFYMMHILIIFAPAYAIIAGTLTVNQVKKP